MIIMKVDTSQINRLNKDLKRFPIETRNGINKWGKLLQRNMRLAIRRRAYWKGNLWKSTLWYGIKSKGKMGKLEMFEYGVAVDRGRPRWVALKRGRPIRKWALEKGLAIEDDKRRRPLVLIYPFKTSSIYVRPKYFINPVIQKAEPKLMPMIKNELDKIR